MVCVRLDTCSERTHPVDMLTCVQAKCSLCNVLAELFLKGTEPSCSQETLLEAINLALCPP